MQFKKKKKENKTKGGKKGGNCKGPVIIYRLKGAEVRRILGITQFSEERRGELPMNPGGGGGHKNITEPHGGMGESAKLHCDTPRILRPPISPPPPPLPLPLPPGDK